MSATGQGGVTLIAGRNHGELTPVLIAGGGGTLTFNHNVGRRAYQVIVTSGDVSPPNFEYGSVFESADGIDVEQPTVNQIVVTNTSRITAPFFIACRWEENTVELDLVLTNGNAGTSDPRVVIGPD